MSQPSQYPSYKAYEEPAGSSSLTKDTIRRGQVAFGFGICFLVCAAVFHMMQGSVGAIGGVAKNGIPALKNGTEGSFTTEAAETISFSVSKQDCVKTRPIVTATVKDANGVAVSLGVGKGKANSTCDVSSEKLFPATCPTGKDATGKASDLSVDNQATICSLETLKGWEVTFSTDPPTKVKAGSAGDAVVAAAGGLMAWLPLIFGAVGFAICCVAVAICCGITNWKVVIIRCRSLGVSCREVQGEYLITSEDGVPTQALDEPLSA